jgi:signal transduction histidine kinase
MVRIADTGDGIGGTDVHHVFEPFYSTKPGGSGLGLALVHRILQDHGGDIDVDSTPGAGSTFTLRIPARRG